MTTSDHIIEDAVNAESKHGFITDIETESAPPGLNEHIIRLISRKKGEPNYSLEKCHNGDPLVQRVKPVTLFSSFTSFTFRHWDEQRRNLVGYRHLKGVRRSQV